MTTEGINPYNGSRVPRSRIAWAVENTPSMSQAARACNLSYNTFRKYAMLYDMWNPNPSGKGTTRKQFRITSKAKLNDIFNNKYPMLPPLHIMEKLLKSGLKSQECEICGYDRMRATDMTSPLLLDFLDGNIHNHALKNLRLLCYNCFYLTHGIKPPKNIPVIRLGDFTRKLITAFDDIL